MGYPIPGACVRIPLKKPPIAIVTGANHPTALGAGRALHQAGARVLGVTTRSTDPPIYSKVWNELHIVPGDMDSWVNKVRELGERAGHPVFLLPTQDRLVEEFSLRRAELGENIRVTFPPHSVVELMLDKTRFHAWAAERGLPVPDSYVVRSTDEMRAALGKIQYPAILKPLYRTPEWDRASPKHKAYKLQAANDVDKIPLELFALADAYIVSRWIEGPDSAVHFCLAFCGEPGQVQAASTGQKLLQFPRQTGSTAICRGTESEELLALTAEVFRQAEFLGLGSLEVKYDGDGRPWITEPTVGRPNLQSYSVFARGENFYAMAMDRALGLQTDRRIAKRKNVVWIEERHLFEVFRSGTTDPIPWGLIVSELARIRRVSAAYWCWWDPMPAVRLAGSIAGRAWRKVVAPF